MRVRTGYSFKTAIGKLPLVLDCVVVNKYPAAPISDRCSTFGFSAWAKLCKEAKIKPVFGVELAVATDQGEKKLTIDYWSFFAIDSLRPLHDLIAVATSAPGSEPSLTYAQAAGAKGVLAIAGERCRLEEMKPRPSIAIALSPSLPRATFMEAKRRKFQFVLSSDNQFSRPEDMELYRLALGRRSFTQSYPQHLASDAEIWDSIKWFCDETTFKKAKELRTKWLKRCNAHMQLATMITPEKKKTLRVMCIAGAKRLKCDLTRPVYKARLKRELDLIKVKEFEDYFYVITDLVSWAKKRMVVGPARGSSCGSLVCYLLGITAIDPIPYDLIFERFIDINRQDLPDIDIDFSDVQRPLLFDYVEKKYGSERVARLGTVSMFKPRSAIKQVGQVLDIKPWLLSPTLDSIIERSSGDSRALQVLEDTLKDTPAGQKLLADYPNLALAGQLEGHPHGASQHAAGIVVTQEPVREYVAMDMRTRSIMCDKKDAEALNMLKIDALGLTQLSIFERTMELIGVKPISGWLEQLPLDDPKAFAILNKHHWSGVFQFGGSSLQSLTKSVTIDSLEDIISITALARPGPIATGGSGAWTRRRSGKEPVTYPHPLFEPHLRHTLGVVAYQEQVMQIGREIGDLSWEDVTALRKAMSKSLGKEYFDKYGDRWKKAAKKKGIPPMVLDKVWDDLCAYGSWAFNRSHAVAYGVVSYWCCWLKAHHQVEFAAATLDAESDPQRQIQMLRELDSEGVKYVPVDPDHSTLRWSVLGSGKNKRLLGPLTQIKGIGEMHAKEILKARKDKKPARPVLLKKLSAPVTEIDSLFPIRDAIWRVCPDLEAANILTPPMAIKSVQCGVGGPVVIIGLVRKIAPKDENEVVNVAKRGYAVEGPANALNLFFIDDTDEIFCKVNRYDYERIGRDIVNRGGPGKSLYAVKGTVPAGFRMIKIQAIKYLGSIR